MSNRFFKPSPTLLFVSLIAIAIISSLSAEADNKMAPADVVAKHVESIGAAEARARVNVAIIKGTVDLTVKAGGEGQATGQVLMASQGNQNVVNMTFEGGEPTTAFAYDGSKTSVTQFRPGRHTALEAFFAEHQEIVREGLVGSVLSASWPLLNLQQKNPKLEYAGLKKIEGRELHAMKYSPRKGSELKIMLFFEKDTFRHVRTEYEQEVYASEQRRIAGGGGALPPATSARQATQHLKAFEDFSDFKPEGGLNLPHTYKFELAVQSTNRPILVTWVFNLSEFTFNGRVDPSVFVVSSTSTKAN
ncbi:MAG: hypothetical protein ACXW3C_00570 [Pyrinomonadaceae bacterium]